MSEFSKQWCQIYDPEMPGDFDILEEADMLQPDSYISVICEGFGFVAIGRSINNEIMLAMPVPPKEGDIEEYIHWLPYNEIVQ